MDFKYLKTFILFSVFIFSSAKNHVYGQDSNTYFKILDQIDISTGRVVGTGQNAVVAEFIYKGHPVVIKTDIGRSPLETFENQLEFFQNNPEFTPKIYAYNLETRTIIMEKLIKEAESNSDASEVLQKRVRLSGFTRYIPVEQVRAFNNLDSTEYIGDKAVFDVKPSNIMMTQDGRWVLSDPLLPSNILKDLWGVRFGLLGKLPMSEEKKIMKLLFSRNHEEYLLRVKDFFTAKKSKLDICQNIFSELIKKSIRFLP